jgi:hypothetical protein
MKKKIFLVLLLPILFLFNGCIEIVEEITLNADQSGNVKFYMDLGSLGGMAMNMGESYMQGPLLDQIKKLPETAAGILKGVKGLSNINPVTNKKGLYSVSFDFKNSKQLNQAIYKLFDVKKKFYEPNYIRLTKKKLVKKNYAPILRLFLKKYVSQIKDTSILKLLAYRSTFTFPSAVKRFSNKKAVLSGDKKTLELTCTLEELLSSGTNIGNKVKY